MGDEKPLLDDKTCASLKAVVEAARSLLESPDDPAREAHLERTIRNAEVHLYGWTSEDTIYADDELNPEERS